MNNLRNKKICVLAIDGGNWDLINELILEGLLPNIQKIKNQGAYGDLVSCIPPLTATAWKSYFTGKNLGKLNVFAWREVNWLQEKFYNKLEQKNSNELWDYLTEKNLRSYIFNIPVTYPARSIKGVMISGPPAVDLDRAIYPHSLARDLNNYKIFPESIFHVEKKKVVEEICHIIHDKCKIARSFLRKKNWNFFQFTFFLNDDIQHFFWKYYLGQEKWPHHSLDPVRKVWQLIDYEIGHFIQKIPDPQNTLLVLMSDHGFGEQKAKIFLNSWLIQRGYLKIKKRSKQKSFFLHHNITLDKIGKILNQIGFLGIAQKIIPLKIVEKLFANSEDGYSLESTDVDWQKSQVITPGEGPIYINPKLSISQKEELIKELIHDLENIVNPRNQEKIIRKIYRRDELYQGQFTKEAPELIALPNPGYEISGQISGSKVINYSLEHWSGTHHLEGFYIFQGNDVNLKNNQKIKIIDLLPTFLSYLNIKIPRDLDGQVAQNLFAINLDQSLSTSSQSEPAQNNQYISLEEKNLIQEELKKLGYL